MIRVGITMGDPSGIGPEIIAKSLGFFPKGAAFTVIGDKKVFEKAKKNLYSDGLPRQLNFIDLHNVSFSGFKFGKVSVEYGRASMEYLELALRMLKAHDIDSLVTAPISKEAINKAAFRFPGHTEYLVKMTHAKESAMMLLDEKLKFTLATRHIPISKVPGELNKKEICACLRLTHKALREYFSLPHPRIAVCGLNPHASDNGLLGDEENRIIKPALRSLGGPRKGIYGPLPADTAVAAALKGKFDCLIAMYHDQALIPLKISSPATGVNMTLGLPFVRTSPLHGTAFDIAGKGIADPRSFQSAVELALRCSIARKKA